MSSYRSASFRQQLAATAAATAILALFTPGAAYGATVSPDRDSTLPAAATLSAGHGYHAATSGNLALCVAGSWGHWIERTRALRRLLAIVATVLHTNCKHRPSALSDFLFSFPHGCGGRVLAGLQLPERGQPARELLGRQYPILWCH